MKEEEQPNDPRGVAIWYGDLNVAVLVNWTDGGRVIATLRRRVGECSPSNDRWQVRCRLPRWKALYYVRRWRWPLESKGGGLFHAWYQTPDRVHLLIGAMDVETFIPGLQIQWCNFNPWAELTRG